MNRKLADHERVAAATVLRTVSHLRGRQIAHQLVYRLRGPANEPKRTSDDATPEVDLTAMTVVPAPDGHVEDAGVVLLNQRPHDPIAAGWTPAARDPLWTYTLHYHGFIADPSCSPAYARAAMLSWMGSHTRGVGWEPYPTAMRILYWLGWLSNHADALDANERDTVARSLSAQARHLHRSFEWHLDGNHVWTDAAALATWAAVSRRSWIDDQRGRLLTRFQHIVWRQLGPDGMHLERTPSYHCLLAEQLAIVHAVTHERAPAHAPALRRALDAMVAVLPSVTHPDGDVALWGDSRRGAPTRPAALLPRIGYALSSEHTDATFCGFYRRSFGPWTVMFNVGTLTMPEQVGHAHADGLSIELSLADERVIVDAGNGTYVAGEERRYARSTKAHNTVTVGRGDPDQHELWASHRIGGRARVQGIAADEHALGATLRGFASLVAHRREITWEQGVLRIVDRLIDGTVPAVVRWHLPATVKLVGMAGGWRVTTPAGAAFQIATLGAPLERSEVPGWLDFGVAQRRICLAARLRAGMSTTEFRCVG